MSQREYNVGESQGQQPWRNIGQGKANVGGLGQQNILSDPRLDVNDALLLLVDQQTGLFNLVKDMDVDCLRTNAVSLLRAGIQAQIPVVVTTAIDDGPNGPLLPEFHHFHKHFKCICRSGAEVNPWYSKDLVQCIQQFQKKTIIMAGTLTNVALSLAAVSAVADGFKVFAVIDASGGSSRLATNLALHRMTFFGVIPTDTMSIITELMGSYKRKDIREWYDLSCEVMPTYKLLIESFNHALDIGTGTGKSKDTSLQQRESRFEKEKERERYEPEVGSRFEQQRGYGSKYV